MSIESRADSGHCIGTCNIQVRIGSRRYALWECIPQPPSASWNRGGLVPCTNRESGWMSLPRAPARSESYSSVPTRQSCRIPRVVATRGWTGPRARRGSGAGLSDSRVCRIATGCPRWGTAPPNACWRNTASLLRDGAWRRRTGLSAWPRHTGLLRQPRSGHRCELQFGDKNLYARQPFPIDCVRGQAIQI